MRKALFIFAVLLFVFVKVRAQGDTLLYYANDRGEVVNDRKIADHFIMITNPTTYNNRTLFPVQGYYMNGKLKLVANSSFKSITPLFQGIVLRFYQSGKRESTANYKNGVITSETRYYPNSKVYTQTASDPTAMELLMECYDTSGVAVTKNGNGKWLIFDNDFKEVVSSGSVSNGYRVGEWTEVISNGAKSTMTYRKGILKNGVTVDKDGNTYPFKQQFTSPHSPSITSNFTYMVDEYLNFHSADTIRFRKITMSFTVNPDGTVTNLSSFFKLSPGVENLMRKVITSTKWLPATYNGVPIKMEAVFPSEKDITNYFDLQSAEFRRLYDRPPLLMGINYPR